MITEHTLRVLEYDRFLSAIAERAASAMGRELALALRPHTDPAVLRHERELMAESVALHGSPGGFPGVAHDDLRPVLDAVRAAGAVLDSRDLLRVARTLRVVREVKSQLASGAAVGQRLRDLGEALVDSRDLESRITHAIGPDGEILDEASPKLAKLRRQAFVTRESLRTRLESFLQHMELRSDGEAYVTFRSGRYVVPVAAGDRGRVRGIVHDQSASGQTLFIEPFVAVEENNALARCEAESHEEERRILIDLSDRVAEFGVPLRSNAEILGKLDFLRAVVSLAGELGMVMPEIDEQASGIRLVRARHPVLLRNAAERDAIVPLELDLEDGKRILILTGPNMGGKTVALKTLGLAAAMAMSALPVAAETGTAFPFLRTVAADIGDEQSISQNLSTFASHLKYLVEFLIEKEDPALVLLDELGTGTEPAEGGALARAYLEALDGAQTFIVATTHLTQLKDFAARHPRAVNGAMSFDESTLSPLYTLVLGTPGRSRAIEVASRLDFPRPVLDRARELLSAEERQMDELLADVELARERVREEEARSRAAAEEAAARLLRAEEHERRAEALVKEARAAAAEEAERMLREAENLVKETRRKLVEAPATPAVVEETGRAVRAERERTVREIPPPPEHGADYPPVAPEDVRPGVELWSVDLGSAVRVEDVPSSRGLVHVSKGGIRFNVSVDRLRRQPGHPGRPEPARARTGHVVSDMTPASEVSPELDLRGMTGPDAVEAVEQYLDSALLAGLGIVRIIHGKGTGILRQRVTEVLGRHFGVLRHRLGESGEGGAGVTIAYLGER